MSSVGLFAPDQDVHPQKEAIVVFKELVFSHNTHIRIIDLDELACSRMKQHFIYGCIPHEPAILNQTMGT